MEKIVNSDSSFFSFLGPFLGPFRAALALLFATNANLTKKFVKFNISIKNALLEFDFGLEK
jgi:hypothetical protein